MNQPFPYKKIYEKHNERYRALREQGEPGWNGSDGEIFIQEMVDSVSYGLKAFAPKAKSLLELGCGDGSVLLRYRALVEHVTGVDIAPLAVTWAQEKASGLSGVEVSVANVLALPFPESTFDVVIDGHCAHCIIGDDRTRFFAEAHRVLKPGGLFVVMSMCNDPKEQQHAFDPHFRCVHWNDQASRHFSTEQQLKEEILAGGFTLLRYTVDYTDTQDGFTGYAQK